MARLSIEMRAIRILSRYIYAIRKWVARGRVQADWQIYSLGQIIHFSIFDLSLANFTRLSVGAGIVGRFLVKIFFFFFSFEDWWTRAFHEYGMDIMGMMWWINTELNAGNLIWKIEGRLPENTFIDLILLARNILDDKNIIEKRRFMAD